MGGDGPGDGHPLLLAAGHLTGPVVGTLRHAHLFQRLHGDVLPVPHGHPLIDQGQGDVLQGIQLLDQVIPLEDEADLPVADVGQLLVGQGGDVGAVQVVLPIGGDVQAAQHIHQGGLARARLAHDGHELPPVDVERDSVQSPDLTLLALVINFVKVFDLDQHESTSINSRSCNR